jgi:hypothetical protein
MPSFSKPFSASNHPYLERRADYTSQIQNPNRNPQSSENSILPEFDAQEFTAGPQSLSRITTTMDANHLIPFKPGGPRAMHSDLSRSGSEPDSLLDLYGRPMSHADNVDQPRNADNKDFTYMDDEDPERSRWIHRDKLALIESHEMQEAGIKLPRLPRSVGKLNKDEGHSRQPSREQYSNGLHQQDQALHDFKLEPPQSQRPSNRHDEEQIHEGEAGFDLRTSAELGQEPHPITISSPLYRQQGIRSSSSRIPLPKSSPMPIPQEHIERNTPLTRTRGGSGNWSAGDEDRVGYVKSRSRSHSVGSQVLLDVGEQMTDSPNHGTYLGTNGSPPTSPAKRLGIKSSQIPSSSARKATNALRSVSDSQKPRTSSATYRSSPGNRPKSRSGLESRPATAINRPEGDAPWLATMYKPDPRLPPDQQILPTHAKRMEQQKEKNGHSGLGPSGKSDLQANHAKNGLHPSSPSSLDPERKEKPDDDEPGWPLRALPPAKGIVSPGPAGTAEQHAGYSTVPKMQTTPPIDGGRAVVTAKDSPPAPQSSNTGPEDTSGKASRACGCCVVM